jgi:hypothetical protein
MDFNQTCNVVKADEELCYTLGIVYEPGVVDAHGDYSTAEEIRKAAWDFTRFLQGNTRVTALVFCVLSEVKQALDAGQDVELDISEIMAALNAFSALGFQHEIWDTNIGDIVENYVAANDFILMDENDNLIPVKKGTWLMGIVWTPEYWAKVKSKEITGLSMGGTGIRVPDAL